MSTVQTWQIVSTSIESTAQLAASLGAKIRGSEVIELVSDIGGGKTTFVRGLAAGMGSHDKVASPTFTISREYKAGHLRLYHFDFYRLQHPGIMMAELAEVLGKPEAVVVIEWANIVADVLPAERLKIDILATGESERSFTFTYPQSLKYLVDIKT